MEKTSPVALSGERIFEIATELLSVDTQNPPGETRGIAGWLESFFADLERELGRPVGGKRNCVGDVAYI